MKKECLRLFNKKAPLNCWATLKTEKLLATARPRQTYLLKDLEKKITLNLS